MQDEFWQMEYYCNFFELTGDKIMAGYILNYREKKAKAREEAIRWQRDFAEHNYSMSELADWQAHFEKEGKKYGLIKEFKENGIV